MFWKVKTNINDAIYVNSIRHAFPNLHITNIFQALNNMKAILEEAGSCMDKGNYIVKTSRL